MLLETVVAQLASPSTFEPVWAKETAEASAPSCNESSPATNVTQAQYSDRGSCCQESKECGAKAYLCMARNNGPVCCSGRLMLRAAQLMAQITPEPAAGSSATISSHVLDTMSGKPAAGVDVCLEAQAGEQWTKLADGRTVRCLLRFVSSGFIACAAIPPDTDVCRTTMVVSRPSPLCRSSAYIASPSKLLLTLRRRVSSPSTPMLRSSSLYQSSIIIIFLCSSLPLAILPIAAVS